MKLFDAHAHTNLSYCADGDMKLKVYQEALDSPGTLVTRQGITNHGFQAYFPPDIAWSWRFLDKFDLFDKYKSRGDDLLLSCKEEVEAFDDRFVFGVETELMGDGRLTISPEVREKTDLLLGSLHVLPEVYEKGSPGEDVYTSFINYTRDLVSSGIDIIAHPFRWISTSMGIVPNEIVTEVISIANEFNVAVELNTRGQSISRLILVQEVARAGATLSLGTDAHTLAEVGQLQKHLEIIKLAGFDPGELRLYNGPVM